MGLFFVLALRSQFLIYSRLRIGNETFRFLHCFRFSIFLCTGEPLALTFVAHRIYRFRKLTVRRRPTPSQKLFCRFARISLNLKS